MLPYTSAIAEAHAFVKKEFASWGGANFAVAGTLSIVYGRDIELVAEDMRTYDAAVQELAKARRKLAERQAHEARRQANLMRSALDVLHGDAS